MMKLIRTMMIVRPCCDVWDGLDMVMKLMTVTIIMVM